MERSVDDLMKFLFKETEKKRAAEALKRKIAKMKEAEQNPPKDLMGNPKRTSVKAVSAGRPESNRRKF